MSYKLSEKWNLDTDFFQVSTYCEFLNLSSIKNCYQDN